MCLLSRDPLLPFFHALVGDERLIVTFSCTTFTHSPLFFYLIKSAYYYLSIVKSPELLLQSTDDIVFSSFRLVVVLSCVHRVLPVYVRSLSLSVLRIRDLQSNVIIIALVCTKYFIIIIQHDDLLGCRTDFVKIGCETT